VLLLELHQFVEHLLTVLLLELHQLFESALEDLLELVQGRQLVLVKVLAYEVPL
jgi:hypothetical protein